MNPEKLRRPLAPGERYTFPGWIAPRFECKAVAFDGHPDDIGGARGVSIKWLTMAGKTFFYPFSTEAAFWNNFLFRDAISVPLSIRGRNRTRPCGRKSRRLENNTRKPLSGRSRRPEVGPAGPARSGARPRTGDPQPARRP